MKKFIMLAALALGSVQFTMGQTKVGVIKLQEGLLATAELKKAQANLQAKYKPRQEQLEKVQRDLDAIRSKMENPKEMEKLSQAGIQDLQLQGQRREREAQRLQQDLEEDFNRDRQEILSRAGSRMNDVVKKVAEEKGLDVVIDIGNTVYFKAGLDITKDVIAAYDKAYPAN